MKTCKKHIDDPAHVYRECVGCELQALRDEVSRLNELLRSATADKGQVNPEHTLFNEIRISEPVNEDGEPTRYLITEAQLQRIRALEADKGQGEPVAWANWKVGTKSYVPYRTKEEASRSVESSEICATQLGPYRVVPLYAEQAAPVAVAKP